jgi:hypothetical protein
MKRGKGTGKTLGGQRSRRGDEKAARRNDLGRLGITRSGGGSFRPPRVPLFVSIGGTHPQFLSTYASEGGSPMPCVARVGRVSLLRSSP